MNKKSNQCYRLTGVNVYRVRDNAFVHYAQSEADAVFWCKMNQLSVLPNGSWEDDYYLQDYNSKEYT